MAISTPEMGNADQAGLMSLRVYGGFDVYMDVLWSSRLNLVLELTVGGGLGPWYVATNIPTGLDSRGTDQHILLAAEHFRHAAGGLFSTLKSERDWWTIFRQIWDMIETGEGIA